jgi:DNA-binding transcriptional regulator YdaS (Cro superfamily)
MEPTSSQQKYCKNYLNSSEPISQIDNEKKRRFNALQADPLVSQGEQSRLKVQKITQENMTESIVVSEEHVGQLLESPSSFSTTFLKTNTLQMIEQSVKGQITHVELRDFLLKHNTKIISLNLNCSLISKNIELNLMKLLFSCFPDLSFSQCRIVDLENYSFNRSLSTLEKLTFDKCTGVTDKLLAYLPPSLRELSIYDSPLTIEGIKHLSRLPLRSLTYNFGDVSQLNSNEQQLVDIEFLQAISSISTLKKIDLSGCHFPKELEWKKILSSVKYLDISSKK